MGSHSHVGATSAGPETGYEDVMGGRSVSAVNNVQNSERGTKNRIGQFRCVMMLGKLKPDFVLDGGVG